MESPDSLTDPSQSPDKSDPEPIESAISAVESLELSLDEFDASEFDLPVVLEPPTLESILNEPDGDCIDVKAQEDELISDEKLLYDEQAETSSLSSFQDEISSKSLAANKLKWDIRYAEHGSVLRHVILKGVSGQINSAKERIDAGVATCLAVGAFIAVGTSHGLVLVFDPKQVLKCCLGNTSVGSEFGSISAICFNRDSSRLLCGFAKGQITMWDVNGGKLIRTITDAHPPGSAILHVKFTDDPTFAIFGDSSGSVYSLEFRRVIGVRSCESKCLFSGSRGEACNIEPLLVPSQLDHSIKALSLVAICSLSKVLVVSVKPRLAGLFAHPLKGEPATLPILSWQFVVIQTKRQSRVVDPVLAFARDRTMFFYQFIFSAPLTLHSQLLQKVQLDFPLLNLTWLNSRTIVILDKSEALHLIDVKTEEELEVIDLGMVELSYSSSFYKSLANGGNVSKALAYAGESACFQSFISFSGQLILLGMQSVHVVTVRAWDLRLDSLLKKNCIADALQLALNFYTGSAKAVVGLPASLRKSKPITSTKVVEILLAYIHLIVSEAPREGQISSLVSYFRNHIPLCIETCIIIEQSELIFEQVCPALEMDPIASQVFLESLESFIISDCLRHVPPSVMQQFVHHYEENKMFGRLEKCILHLNITSFDIHQVVSVCRAHGLCDAIFFIYNNGMLDFVTPLEYLISDLNEKQHGQSAEVSVCDDKHVKVGHKLLVYISCCLAGRAYPIGDIPQDIALVVRRNVLECLMRLHTATPAEDEPAYPFLKILLHFDTREFLNVLALSFEEPAFTSDEGREEKQRIVDILLHSMVESIGFSPTQIGMLFTFLARQMAKQDGSIMVSRYLFQQVLQALTSEVADLKPSSHEERQQALLELLHAGGLQHFNKFKLISHCEVAKFYRVCEYLYEGDRQYNKVLQCYWRDKKDSCFDFVNLILRGGDYSCEEKDALSLQVIESFKNFVEVDNVRAAALVIEHFPQQIVQIMSSLADDDQALFQFLNGLFYPGPRSAGFESQSEFDAEVHEKFLDLMCRFEPRSVLLYLRGSSGWQPEAALAICQRHQLLLPVAFIHEILGEQDEAFRIHHQEAGKAFGELEEVIHQQQEQRIVADRFHLVEGSLVELIQFLQRNASKLENNKKEELWFIVLESAMKSLQHANSSGEIKDNENFFNLIRLVLNGMMNHVPLQVIIQKLLTDPVYDTGRYGDVKQLLLGMLDTYHYEKTLLQTCANLVNHDLFLYLEQLAKTTSRGIHPSSSNCVLCRKLLIKSSSPAVCFRCGHSFHQACLKSLLDDDESSWCCLRCLPTKETVAMPRVSRVSSCSSSQQASINPETWNSVQSVRYNHHIPSKLSVSDDAASGFSNEEFQLQLAPPPLFG